MATSPSQPKAPEAHKLLTSDELSQALKIDVYDAEGKTHTLGDLTKDRRTALIFIRHFCSSLRNNHSSAHAKPLQGV
jgi:hypothetical protein